MNTPGKKRRDAGDFFPKLGSYANSPEEEEQPAPPTAPSSSGLQSRNLTPRGIRFENLDDALRNITGRSTSNTSSRKLSSAADTSEFDDIPLRQLNTPSGPGLETETMLDCPQPSPLPHLPNRALTQTPAANISVPRNRNGPLIGEASSRNSSGTAAGDKNSKTASSMPSDASGNTVDLIYRQYQSPTPDIVTPYKEAKKSEYTLSAAHRRYEPRPPSTGSKSDHEDIHLKNEGAFHIEPDTAKLISGVSGITLHRDSTVHLPKATPNVAGPEATYLASNRVSLDEPEERSHTERPPLKNSPKASHALRSVFDDESEEVDNHVNDDDDIADNKQKMFPMPLRFQFSKVRGNRASHLSSAALSSGELASDSDEDPFKYDKQKYTGFLKPSKEREVSAALRRASNIGRHSQGTLCSLNGSPLKTPPPPLPRLDGGFYQLDTSTARSTRNARTEQNGFFETSALGSPGRRQSNPTTVKVAFNKVTAPKVKDPHFLNEKNLGLGAYRPSLKKGPASEAEDWETVLTEGREHGSRRAACPARSFPDPGVFKPTGNSIADVSDTESWTQEAPEEYGSRERILQHPSNEADAQRFKLCHLKGPDMPIFIPKQRVHRVNGFAQESSRLFSEASGPSSMSTSAPNSFTGRVAGSLQNFHQRNKERLATFRSQQPGLDLEQNSTSQTNVHSLQQPIAVASRYRHREISHTRGADQSYTRPSLSTISDRSHGFSFNLIPLPEAARLQAIRRASGDEDHTGIGNTRGSDSSSDQGRLPRLPRSVHYQGPPDPVTSSESPHNRIHGSSDQRPKLDRLQTLSTMNSSAPVRSYSSMGPLDGNMEPRQRFFDDPSRLIPLEERRRLQTMDPELRAIAMRGGFYDQIPVDLDAFLSDETIARRRIWFAFMIILSIFPFFAILIWTGKFNDGLSWYTNGEVHSLSQRQKRILVGLLIAHCIVLPALSVFLIVYYAFPALRA